MIDDYYQTYKQMVAENTPDAKQNAAKKICKTWSDLAERKGLRFSVLLTLYLVLTITVLFLIIFRVVESIVVRAIFIVAWGIMTIVLGKMDDKWRERTFFLNIFYFDSIENAKKLKMALKDKFRFDSLQQYQMILTEAEHQVVQMREQIENKRQKAEQLLFGGILGILLAFGPAILTGLLDNATQTSDTFQNALYIAAYSIAILIIPIAVLVLNYYGKMWGIWKLEKEYADFSEFHADIKMLVEIEAGLHPLADDPPKESN